MENNGKEMEEKLISDNTINQIDPVGNPEALTEQERPPQTKWRFIRTLCGKLTVAEIIGNKKVFWGYWEKELCMPISVCLMISFSLISYLLFTLPFLSKTNQIISSINVFSFLTLFLWSYFGAMCMDPGYLPFDWIYSQKSKYTAEELLSGTAITKSQILFGKAHKLDFAPFSASYGRYVIRGDHICGWVTNWIGKRNHKQFILMNLYGGLYCASIFVWRFFIRSFTKHVESGIIMIMFSSALELMFMMTLLWTFAENIFDLAMNETQITRYRGDEVTNNGCCESMKEVCGEYDCIQWILPTPAFDDQIPLQY